MYNTSLISHHKLTHLVHLAHLEGFAKKHNMDFEGIDWVLTILGYFLIYLVSIKVCFKFYFRFMDYCILSCADKMTSSSSSMIEKIAPKPIVFKYQGAPDRYAEIKDTELGHIDWNAFLTICNKPNKGLPWYLHLFIMA